MEKQNTLEKLEKKIEKMPIIGEDVLEFIQLLNDPESNFDNVVERVSPELAARFLSIANSAYYGREVRSIHYAVKLLGYRKMKDILITSMLMDHLTRHLEGFNYDKFMNQAQFCGAISGILGDILDYDKLDDLFTIAILQNIGKLVIAVYLEEEHKAIIALKKSDGLPSSKAEQRVLGITHAEIGAMVLKRFTIPDDICEAVKFHDSKEKLDTGELGYQLKAIARESTGIVGNFTLPEEFSPTEIPALLKEAIKEGKKEVHDIIRKRMRTEGYDELFTVLLKKTSKLVYSGLKKHLHERAAHFGNEEDGEDI
jgi:HD-like signal output (HDOD) protein